MNNYWLGFIVMFSAAFIGGLGPSWWCWYCVRRCKELTQQAQSAPLLRKEPRGINLPYAPQPRVDERLIDGDDA